MDVDGRAIDSRVARLEAEVDILRRLPEKMEDVRIEMAKVSGKLDLLGEQLGASDRAAVAARQTVTAAVGDLTERLTEHDERIESIEGWRLTVRGSFSGMRVGLLIGAAAGAGGLAGLIGKMLP